MRPCLFVVVAMVQSLVHFENILVTCVPSFETTVPSKVQPRSWRKHQNVNEVLQIRFDTFRPS